MDPKLIFLNDVDAYRENGLPFRTVEQARWMHRNRNFSGFGHVFPKIGGRICIDVVAFHAAVASNKSQQT